VACSMTLRISGPVVLSNFILEQFRQFQTMPIVVAVLANTPSQVPCALVLRQQH
jgi:hypothetical protein